MSNWDKLLPDGKGGYDLLRGWGFGRELLYRAGGKVIVFLFLIPLIGPIFPLFFLLSYPIRTMEGKMENCLTGAILSFVFLLDFWLGGIGWIFFDSWSHGGTSEGIVNIYLFFGKFNLALIALFAFLWYLTPHIGEMIDITEATAPVLIFFFVVFFLMWKVLMPIFGYITDATIAETPLSFLESLHNDMLD